MVPTFICEFMREGGPHDMHCDGGCNTWSLLNYILSGVGVHIGTLFF